MAWIALSVHPGTKADINITMMVVRMIEIGKRTNDEVHASHFFLGNPKFAKVVNQMPIPTGEHADPPRDDVILRDAQAWAKAYQTTCN